MRMNNGFVTRLPGLAAAGAGAVLVLITAAASMVNAEEDGVSFDGLKRVENSKVAKAYIDPDADFSVYQRIKILEPYVAFRKNWQRDLRRRGIRNVRSSDM